MAAPTNAALVKKALANSEPSTHGPETSFAARQRYIWNQRTASIAEFDHNGIAEALLPSSVMYGGRIDQIAAQRAPVLRPISWARRGNGLNQTLAQTEIEQLDVRIDAEL